MRTVMDVPEQLQEAIEMDVAVKTVKSGRQYRAVVEGFHYNLMLNDEDQAVFIYTKDSCVGGYRLDRFGGALTPASVRQFFSR